LKIYPAATLILDAGAIVHLESPESNIRIEGTLVLNGDIDFQGYGYFEFGYGNKLEFGPGVANFRLEGRGIGNRFARLSANLDVEAGHGVLWSHGKMESPDGTLLINAGGSCRFNFMEVVGSGPAYDGTVIAADNANLLTFDYCDFNQIGTGLSSKNSGLHRFISHILPTWTMRCSLKAAADFSSLPIVLLKITPTMKQFSSPTGRAST
jgi:hypothetical protein